MEDVSRHVSTRGARTTVSAAKGSTCTLTVDPASVSTFYR